MLGTGSVLFQSKPKDSRTLAKTFSCARSHNKIGNYDMEIGKTIESMKYLQSSLVKIISAITTYTLTSYVAHS
jgi:hypothetical protein